MCSARLDLMIGIVSIPTRQLFSTLADRSASSRRRHRTAVLGAILMFSYCARRYSSFDMVGLVEASVSWWFDSETSPFTVSATDLLR